MTAPVVHAQITPNITDDAQPDLLALSQPAHVRDRVDPRHRVTVTCLAAAPPLRPQTRALRYRRLRMTPVFRAPSWGGACEDAKPMSARPRVSRSGSGHKTDAQRALSV